LRTVAGVVRDTDGNPVAGVEVRHAGEGPALGGRWVISAEGSSRRCCARICRTKWILVHRRAGPDRKRQADDPACEAIACESRTMRPHSQDARAWFERQGP
jgi:hypothetical protein